eukprot:gene2350-2387_t
MNIRPIAAVPLVLFLGLAGLFLVRLGAGDSSRLPSALIGKKVPDFQLPPLDPQSGSAIGLDSAHLAQGHVSILNIFASWCGPCQEEHPLLMRLAADQALKAKGLKLYGLAYKDKPANSQQFLNSAGQPYDAIGRDESGRTAIDFGVYGVPETFVIKGDGTIAYKFIGPLTPEQLETTLKPEILKAMN